MEVQIDDIKVMCVKAKGGVSGSEKAFLELESKLPSLKKGGFTGCF